MNLSRHFPFTLISAPFLILIPLLILLLSGCQLGYILKNGYHQISLLTQGRPLSDILKDPLVDTKTKEKVRLTQEVLTFAREELGLKPTKNYQKYVRLEGPYVTYVVSAASAFELTPHLWSFPIIGEVPYKGFFQEKEAQEEENKLAKSGLDTHLRGVIAFSTLGWFNDPLLSSMLTTQDHHLVNTLIHESLHATVYIKNQSELNERLATFVGNKGTELFYLKREGPASPTLRWIQDENSDESLFSQFITKELEDLKIWYTELENQQNGPIQPPISETKIQKKQARLKEIQQRFQIQILPHLKTKMYRHFGKLHLNNANLLVYKTYFSNLADLEKKFANCKEPSLKERFQNLFSQLTVGL